MTREISNSDDVIDSRDVIERIEELEEQLAALSEEDRAKDKAHPTAATTQVSDEYHDLHCELTTLKALAEEAEGYAPDWRHGASLIRDSYFKDYAEELIKDIGDLPRELPHYIAIDWKKTAENIKVDYTSVEYDGVTYWVR
jgi:hypothetical protein